MTLIETALARHRSGDLAAAATAYRSILATAPGDADANHLLGLALLQQGTPDAALPPLQAAIALSPHEPLYCANFARAALAAGQPEAAESALRMAIAVAPADPGLHHDLGLTLLRLHRPREAEASLRRCIALQPEAMDAHINLAAAQCAQNRPDGAAETLARVLVRDPVNIPALCGQAAAYRAAGRLAAAAACLRRAHAIRPDDHAIAGSLGNVLRSLGDLDAALPLLEAAATDGGADALNNLALVHSDAGQLDEAEALFTRALAADPGHADAAYNRATARLLAGRYREGWPGFELRWQRRGHMAPFGLATPRWDGAPTTQQLLLHAEQGLGDTIMAARFLPHIAAPHLTVVVPQTLLMLLRPLAPRANWLPLEHGIPPHDCNAALMSLPAILDLDEAGLGAPPYLHVPEHRVAQWRARLADLPGRRIGLAWAGNPGYAGDAARSIAPGLLAPLSESRNASFVSLQRGDAPPFVMTDWTGELTDMPRTAALVAALDLVITVDTAIAHLAGALGRPVWLLNRFAPCWRWPLGREDNPWYATLRQFRQPAPGDWPSVIAAVRAALNGERLHRLGGDFRRININAEPRPGRHMHEPA